MTSRLMLAYAEREGGRSAVERVLAHAGCAHREAELLDEAAWFSFATKIRLFEALCVVLDDPEAVRKAGAAALELSVANGLKVALRALGSPAIVYRNVVRANAKFSAIHSLELLELGRSSTRVAFSDNVGYDVHPLDCDYTSGLLSIVPVLFGMPAARVEHPTCAAQGHDRCVYELSWNAPGVSPRALLGTGALAAGTLGGSALLAPALLPAAAVVSLGAAGMLVRRAVKDVRGRLRHFERELTERDAVAQRMAASLQDLVTELELDEVLAKTVRNASAAVASKQFALFIEEDGGLRCGASSGVPDQILATVQAWIERDHAERTDVLLVEDVAVVPGLAALRDGREMPVGSVCLIPLIYRGAVVGHLVAMAPQSRTFLPRDLELVRSYAIPAAIALANARLFAVQRALATRDPLTGLLNHREFHESVDRELDRARRHGGETAVALFDLDGFKLVNDSAGHAEGDRVLRAVAEALQGACRSSDMAFRIGGDEFALLLPATGRREAMLVANRVRRAVGGVDPRVGASIGMASWPEDGGSKDVLLAHADASLYAMKGAQGERRSAAASPDAPAAQVGPLLRERLAVLNRLAGRLSGAVDPTAIARLAVAELEGSCGYDLAYVHRLDGDVLQAVAVGGTLTGGRDVPLWSHSIDRGVSGRVVRSGRAALVHDTALDADHVGAELVDPEADVPLRSQLAVPLVVAGRTWGVLSVQDTERSAFGSDDLLLLELVGGLVAGALQRAEHLRSGVRLGMAGEGLPLPKRLT